MANPKGNSQPGPEKVTSAEELSAEPKAERDTWDYIEILARPAAAFITALAVASIGIFANLALNESNQAAQERAVTEQNTRLYTQLLSSREQSDSNLRKDMFNTILSGFLSKSDGAKESENDVVRLTSDRLLKLELLALNFGDTLSLRPLFQELDRNIEWQVNMLKETVEEKYRSENSNNVDEDELSRVVNSEIIKFKDTFLPRLENLARRVSDQQASVLAATGVPPLLISIRPEMAGASKGKLRDNVYHWPSDGFESYWNSQNRAVTKEEEESEEYQNKKALEAKFWEEEYATVMQTLSLDGYVRKFELTISKADYINSEVVVNLKIEDIAAPDNKISLLRPIDMKFKLNYFSFPMIDNTRLSGDHRFALILRKFNQDEILIEGFIFPGTYASYRDKPFLNDAVDQLKLSNKAPAATNSDE